MQVKCPRCGQAIGAGDVNVSTDLALCRSCNETFALSGLVPHGPAGGATQVDLELPPKGAWCRPTANGCEIGATTRSPAAFFIVPFMLIWSGISLGGIYGSQIVTGQFNPMLSLFGIPFLLGSVIFWTLALMAIWGKVTVALDRQGGEVFVGLGGLGYRRRFLLEEIAEVKEIQSPWGNYGGHWYGGIVLEGKRRIRFGSMINDSRRYFFVSALRQVLAGMRPG